MNKAIWIEFIAFFAGLATTISFAPQVMKIWKERNPKSISLGMYVIFLFGVCMWFIVGALLGSVAMMFWNGITITLAITIIVLKLRFSRYEEREKGEWHSRNQLP